MYSTLQLALCHNSYSSGNQTTTTKSNEYKACKHSGLPSMQYSCKSIVRYSYEHIMCSFSLSNLLNVFSDHVLRIGNIISVLIKLSVIIK